MYSGRRLVKWLTCLAIVFLFVAVLGACKKAEKEKSSTAIVTTAVSKSQSITSMGTKTTALKTTSESVTGSDISTQETYEDDFENEEEAAEPDDSDSEANEPSEKVFDLGGRTFTVVGWQDYTIPRLGVDPYMDEQYNNWIKAEEKYNFKLNYIAYPNAWNDFTNSFIAGIKFADVVNMTSVNAFPNRILANMLACIDDYIVNINDPGWNRELHMAAAWKDKLYGFNKVAPGGEIGFGVIYNKDLLKKEGFEDLHQIMQRGEWTWDVFLELARIATKDYNGDGIIDQWGVGAYNRAMYINTLRYSNGGQVLLYKDGRYDTGIMERNAITALQFAADIINYYKFSSISILNYNSFYNGLTPMMLSESWVAKDMFVGRTLNKMENIGFVLPPKGPDVSDYQNWRAAANIFVFPADNEDLEASVKIFYEAYIQNLNNASQNFDILKHLEYFFPNAEFFEIFKKYATKVQYDFFSGFTGLNAIINNTVNNAVNGNVPVGSILETNRPRIQEIIDTAN